MTMTRKDYVVLARALSLTKPTHVGPAGYGHARALAQWVNDLTAICNVLKADNPRFDRSRFLAAAGHFTEEVSPC
jgi:hypothetical protein